MATDLQESPVGQDLRTTAAGRQPLARYLREHWVLYLFVLPTVLYFVIFHYWPMYGAVIAFKHFTPIKGILGSPWAGFAHFERFFNSYFFELLIRNTILISVYVLVAAFPVPIAFALMVNQVDYPLMRKTLQTASYIPHFISMVVFIGMIFLFLSPTNGVVNRLIMFFGGGATDFMGSAAWFRHVYVGTEIWKETGFAAIIYLAVLSTINPELHEAAIVDGANRFRRILHIDIPSILPTIVVLLIIQCGQIMTLGFEKVYLMQVPLNLARSEIIATYVYKVGLVSSIPNYSYGAAIGLFNAVINLLLILAVNRLAKTISGQSLW